MQGPVRFRGWFGRSARLPPTSQLNADVFLIFKRHPAIDRGRSILSGSRTRNSSLTNPLDVYRPYRGRSARRPSWKLALTAKRVDMSAPRLDALAITRSVLDTRRWNLDAPDARYRFTSRREFESHRAPASLKRNPLLFASVSSITAMILTMLPDDRQRAFVPRTCFHANSYKPRHSAIWHFGIVESHEIRTFPV